MNDSVISCSGIDKSYGEKKVLSGVSFEVREGELHGFLGPNGAGKSTLIKIFCGILLPDAGELKLFGQKDPCIREFSSEFGFLPEVPPLYEQMQVKEFLYFIAKIKGVRKTQLESLVSIAIEKLLLGELQSKLIGHLSRGQRQKVAIAQALVHNPRLIILDEPTLGLDPKSIFEMRSLIKELQKEHTIFLSSHLLKEVEEICSHVTIINQGKILKSGRLSEMFAQKKKFRIKVLSEFAVARDFLEQKELVVTSLAPQEYLLQKKNADSISQEEKAMILKQLISLGPKVCEASDFTPSLETSFLQLLEGKDK